MTKAERRRFVAWRFKVLQQATGVPRNVARTCRHFGISRKTYYKWKRRYDDHREAGLCDRPRIPHRSREPRRATSSARFCICGRPIISVRGGLRDYLKRFHRVSVATSTVHRILGRHGMQRLPANQKHRSPAARWNRYEKPQPGHRLQLDVKFLERIPGTQKRLYQFTAIDDCTRLRVLKVYDACNQRTAIQFIDEVLPALAVPRPRHSNGQWRRVSVTVPLARGKPGYPPCLHPAADAAPQWQGRAITSRRQRRVLPAPRREGHHRRHPSVQ